MKKLAILSLCLVAASAFATSKPDPTPTPTPVPVGVGVGIGIGEGGDGGDGGEGGQGGAGGVGQGGAGGVGQGGAGGHASSAASSSADSDSYSALSNDISYSNRMKSFTFANPVWTMVPAAGDKCTLTQSSAESVLMGVWSGSRTKQITGDICAMMAMSNAYRQAFRFSVAELKKSLDVVASPV